MEDFENASIRHWQDAELLLEKRRWANADQLYGLAAECRLKSVLASDFGSPIAARYRLHIDQLWSLIPTLAHGRLLQRFAQDLDHTNPFADWNISQRYAHEKEINEEKAICHRAATDHIMSLCKRAHLEGPGEYGL